MRYDSLGIFWEDLPPPPKVKKEPVKRTPPKPVWLEPGYIPSDEILDEATVFDPPVMTDDDLMEACCARDHFVFDIECYPNYFIASFRSVATGKVIYFEMDDQNALAVARLKWILENVITVGFNSLKYDLPITFLAIAGKSCEVLKIASDEIILQNARPEEILKRYKAPAVKINHIDLIEVAPLRASLKVYGGRLHVGRMQDLPFHPNEYLTHDQRLIVKWYNIAGDLECTKLLHDCLVEELNLRLELSNETGIDLRSKSDPQIAESVIAKELTKELGFTVRKPKPEKYIGIRFRYHVPHFIQYQTPLLNWMLETVRSTDFLVDVQGYVQMPGPIKDMRLHIGESIYRMGIGGLHSSEQSCAHVTDEQFVLIDKDVTSYYPAIILNLHLFPEHLTIAFLRVYRRIVQRRVAAKARHAKSEASTLKIVVNGMFGKLGNPHSIFYSPHLLIQVTLTGQLSLLMLIERLELAGIPVVSANTDGIVIKCPRALHTQMDAIIEQWQKDTGFETEETDYLSVYSRDVNNYLALKTDGSVKKKGAFANPWHNAKRFEPECLHKNPVTTICIAAVEALLTKGIPIEDTVCNCADIRSFISIRNVKGGAVKVWKEGENERIEYLGKAVRWYYAKDVEGEIVYATNGNKVPRSDGAKPCMKLPEQFPEDIDFQWYIDEAYSMLAQVGYNVPAE